MITQHRLRGDVAILVPAAGSGVRMGPGDPKALRQLAGRPLLVHAVHRLAAARSAGWIVVAAPPERVAAVADLLAPVAPVTVVPGGTTRQRSVAAALAAAPPEAEIVLVHDAARALTPPDLVDTVSAAVRAGHDAVVPVLPVVDTVKRVSDDGFVTGTVDRAALRTVQTPQGFRRAVLLAAHAAASGDHTDDAGLVERMGGKVYCVPGSEYALKITRPIDLAVAEMLLSCPAGVS